MKFIDWWIEFSRGCPLDMTDIEMAKQAWEAGIQEGIGRKREWVGLTRDEFKLATEECLNEEDYWEAIEAKLKEKNT